MATLVANTAAAQATVTELESRILRAGVELAELQTLANADGTSGKLDEALAKRTAIYDAYVNDASVSGDKGPRQLAIDAKATADAAVKERTVGFESDGVTPLSDGGDLVEARIAAQADWDAKIQLTTQATTNLTTALPIDSDTPGTLEDNKLTRLRAAVV